MISPEELWEIVKAKYPSHSYNVREPEVIELGDERRCAWCSAKLGQTCFMFQVRPIGSGSVFALFICRDADVCAFKSAVQDDPPR